jgi:pyridoxamine 5'-phosphate oxidase
MTDQIPHDDIAEDEPFAPFARWFSLAMRSETLAETVMLATATADGRPSLRAVLLKGADERGFVFYSNLDSRKGEELAANPHAALCLHWKSLARQVRVEGEAAPVSTTEADAYFATRARDSQIGAWASDQSRPLVDRGELERRFALFARQYAEPAAVPRPANWSGFRVCPERIEFWQERPHRLHDRVVFLRDGERWLKQRLFP